MATVAVTATAQPANVPPRVKVDITDSGTPAITSVNVVRKDAAGNASPVRTLDGNPLTLTTSGSTRVGTVYDYEPFYGVPYTYSTVEYPAGASASTTLASPYVRLVHPADPSKSQVITVATWGNRTRKVNRGVFYPMGRSTPVVVTDGKRQAAEFELSVITQTAAEADALEDLVADGATLLLNIPADKPWNRSPEYVSIGDMTETPFTRLSAELGRTWTLPCTVTDRPAGGSQAQWTLADVAATFASLNAVQAAYPTLNAVAFPPS